MAYRLRQNESVGKGLRRVVTNELTSAINQLEGPSSGERIHNARKSIKKLRTILQLVGDDVGADSAKKTLRRAAHALAPLRDAEAVVGSAQTLCTRARGALPTRTCVALNRLLRRQKVRLERVAKRDRVTRRAVKALQDLQRATPSWHWNEVGFSSLAAAIRRSYKKAQRGMRAAQADNRSTRLHEWRKRVKALWYALRLLERRTRGMNQHLADLKRLEDLLGDERNLVVLRTRLWAAASEDLEHSPHLQVSEVAVRRQEMLRREALTLGTRVFNPRPKDFVGHLGRRSPRRAPDEMARHRAKGRHF